ncbi:hypothetical protein [Pectobacterium versatile]|uniref:hypothetical protein n=1 Tax=Pectobacterium versatile TaxID=2488639 RepID=UPI00102EFFA6|nr:hypothetical protein [Pectobacterium versatile]MBN3194017.1 hypothetical protein [Pectobacterium versatile]TAI93185.1 hypothetical protein EG335_21185 [Pectobacterium versatile]
MKNNKEIMEKFDSLCYDEKIEFLADFQGNLDLDIANFLMEVSLNRRNDDELRIEAIKVIGLYKGQYDDREIKGKLFSIVFSEDEDEDDEVKVYVLNTLSFLDLDGKDIELAKKIINSNEYILVREAAFSLVSNNKNIPEARDVLFSLKDDEVFGKSAQRELN